MAKGQAAILLIIVVLVAVILFVGPQILNTQPSPTPARYRNDVITLENFQVSNIKPVVGSVVTVSFDLTNNGDKEVKGLVVDFGGTTLASDDKLDIVECEDGSKITGTKGGLTIPIIGVTVFGTADKSCVFPTIPSLDSKKVVASFKVSGEGNRNFLTKVTYAYSGTREAIIPIVDDKTVKTPPVQFRMSQQSYRPFMVEIIPPTKGWAISNQPFEVKFKLRYVGSAAAGKPTKEIKELGIKKNEFGVSLLELERAIDPTTKKEISCQFKPATIRRVSYPMANADMEIKTDREYNCNLAATGIVNYGDQFGYKDGVLTVDFFYEFEFQKSQTITVRKVA